MEPVKLGLVGLGNMGRSHLNKETALDEVTFVGVADVVRAAVDEVSAAYDIPGFYGYRDLIDSGRCEAVLIAAPHPFHAPIAQYAFERGLHVLSEKPIAVTVREADEMLAAAQKAKRLLGVMFQTRTEALYRRAHELVASGAIGRIYRSVMIASHWFRTQAYYDSGSWRGTWRGEGGGVTMNQAPHNLDAFVWLGGKPTRVQAKVATRAHRIEVEDTAEALLEYADGHTGYFYTTTAEWPGDDRFELTGDHGKLVLQGKSLRLYRMPQTIDDAISTGATWGKPEGTWEDIEVSAEPGGHARVVAQFARAIRLGEPLIADGEDGRNALELANAILLSGYRNQAVNLPLDRAEYDAFLESMRAPTASGN
jgi:predicted dehydrogenase